MVLGAFEVVLIVLALGMVATLVVAAIVLEVKSPSSTTSSFVSASLPAWNSDTTTTSLALDTFKEKVTRVTTHACSAKPFPLIQLTTLPQPLLPQGDLPRGELRSSSTRSSTRSSTMISITLNDGASGHLTQNDHLRKVKVVEAPFVSPATATLSSIENSPFGFDRNQTTGDFFNSTLPLQDFQFSAALGNFNPTIKKFMGKSEVSHKPHAVGCEVTNEYVSEEELDGRIILRDDTLPFNLEGSIPSLQSSPRSHRDFETGSLYAHSGVSVPTLKSPTESAVGLNLYSDDWVTKGQQQGVAHVSTARD